jgi:hypothetical protein
MAAMLMFVTLLAGPMTSVRAAEPTPAPSQPAHQQVDSAELSSSLDRVLERREYAWRFPRTAKTESEEKGWLAGFFESIAKTLARWFKKIQGWMDKFAEWLRHLFESDEKPQKESSSISLGAIAKGTMIVLAAALLVMLGVLLWRARKRGGEIVETQVVTAMPDLNEESVTADQLPEDGWVKMARELMQQGELRLALRAFYLASLAHLGQREFIRLERYKSNHDYDRELQRRARGNPALLDAFDENLLVFERAWYGDHDVTPGTLDAFSQNIERIRAC